MYLSTMKKALKYILYFLAFLVVIGIIGFLAINESEPAGSNPEEAERLADKMMAAVNKPAWDTTHYIQWTFKGVHDFIWDKQRNFTKVNWENNEVLLNLNSVKGLAFQDGNQVSGADADALVQAAWKHFCNDSFWLNAVVKAKDPGTERSIVQLEDGSKALKVKYSQGGVTPGDVYLWMLDETGRPTSWKMWVEIIPFGGLEFSWEKWTTLSTGAEIATFHKSWLLDLDIGNLKAGTNKEAIGLKEDIFAGLVQ